MGVWSSLGGRAVSQVGKVMGHRVMGNLVGCGKGALVLTLSDMGALVGCGAEECQDLTHIFKGPLRLVCGGPG